MNNGKICVSVCAETAEKLIEQINLAEELADVIEIRFDCLLESEFDLALQKIDEGNYKKPFLATFRPWEQGGKRELTQHQRGDFFRYLNLKKFTEFVDIEFDMGFILESYKEFNPIHSFHDFLGVPDNLNELYQNLSSNSDIIKIAVQANNITDSITIWKLLERAKREKKEFIPIAMGEAGKWTRILGLAHGAFMTYASLDSGNETAPGQVSAKDLIEIYRAKELDENTDVYGVIGNPVSHSVSPEIQNAAFKFHKLNAVYIPFEVNNLDEFIVRMVKAETREIDLNFKGFSVTIPHKQTIIKHLDFIDTTAKEIGAVNTVKIVDGKLHGYNTDAQGFLEPLKQTYGDLKDAKIAILGAGGSARACVYALKQEGANVTIFARDIEKAKALTDEFDIGLKELQIANRKLHFTNFDVLINTTPLGMKGEFEGETPVIADQIENIKLVYDLVFNPLETKLMKEADKANVPKIGGMAMLVAQGAAQQKIWTGLAAPIKEMNEVILLKLQ